MILVRRASSALSMRSRTASSNVGAIRRNLVTSGLVIRPRFGRA